MPARWRIVGWILLTTALVLVVVVVTARSTLLAQVDRQANDDVAQEVDEFSTFARTGVDPTTARPFTSADRLLEVYLSRQYPGDGELLVGIAGDRVLEFDRASDVDDRAPYDLAADPALLSVVSDPRAHSGATDTPAGPMRWGRVDVETGAGDAALVIAEFTQARLDRVTTTVQLVAAVAAGGLVLTAGIAWLVAGRILAPVRAVRRVAADIGERDLTARVPVEGRDDVAELAATFNAMLDRLEDASTVQRQFVDDAGHELRTPITVVRGHLELLDDDPVSRRATLRLVNDELARMNRIVSDLLVLAKAERPDFLRPRPVDVADLLLDVEAKAQALDERPWLLTEVAEGEVVLDGQRVTQALLQLAANAVRHAPGDQPVEIGSAYVGSGPGRLLSLWVRDRGPGVRPHEAAAIFERFRHGDPARPAERTEQPPDGPAERPGAGLGLSIVRAIAEAHHGIAWVRSQPGHGATFGIDVPAPVTGDPRASGATA